MAEEATGSSPQNEDAPSEPTSPTLEELQRQLAELEAQQTELATQVQLQEERVSEPQLDSRLAVIEEQFRQNFDDRLRGSAPSSAAGVRRGSADSGDVLLLNRVFREVSRCMADEWRPVFDALVAPLPPDAVDQARRDLQQHPPLIQVSHALYK